MLAELGLGALRREQERQALRESVEHHRTLIDSATEVMVVIHDGVPRLANSMPVELSGYSEEELTFSPSRRSSIPTIAPR
jgi:PAS domain-containing protein